MSMSLMMALGLLAAAAGSGDSNVEPPRRFTTTRFMQVPAIPEDGSALPPEEPLGPERVATPQAVEPPAVHKEPFSGGAGTPTGGTYQNYGTYYENYGQGFGDGTQGTGICPGGCKTCDDGGCQSGGCGGCSDCVGGCKHCGHGRHGRGSGLPGCWTGTCNLFPHLPYYVEPKTYYYFRPYNHNHVWRQRDQVVRWNGDPRHPYANEVFQKVYSDLGISPVAPSAAPGPNDPGSGAAGNSADDGSVGIQTKAVEPALSDRMIKFLDSALAK